MFADYLRELQRVTLLQPAEEADHWNAYRQRGSQASRLRLIEAYQPLVFRVVMQLRLPEAQLMDLLQEGAVGLIEAVERFDPGRGVRFSTYATYRVRGRVLNALQRLRTSGWTDPAAPTRVEPDLLLRLDDPEAAAMLAQVEDRALAERALALMERLPPRERAVLRAVVAAEAPRDAARSLRISPSHFYRLQKQAAGRLRVLLGLDGMQQPQRAQGY